MGYWSGGLSQYEAKKIDVKLKSTNSLKLPLPKDQFPDIDFAKHTEENEYPSFLSELKLDSGVIVNLVKNGAEPPHLRLSCDNNKDKKLQTAERSIRDKIKQIVVDHASDTNLEE